MRILFFLVMCALMACQNTAQAQDGTTISMYQTTNGNISGILSTVTDDTVVNSGSAAFITKAGMLNKFGSGFYSFYFTTDTTSGTPAAITALILGSDDGSEWHYLNSNSVTVAALGSDGAYCDSLTVSTAKLANKQNHMSAGIATKFVNGSTRGAMSKPYKYVKLTFVGAGTQNVRVYGVYVRPFRNN